MEQTIEEKIDHLTKIVDGLAIAVQHGFEQVTEELRAVRQDVENVKLRQDNVAHRFELQELSARVMKLEDKVLKR